MITHISKISNGFLSTFTEIIKTKEGITILLLIITIILFILWISKVIKKNGGFITLISFIITIFMSWITWANCDC